MLFSVCALKFVFCRTVCVFVVGSVIQCLYSGRICFGSAFLCARCCFAGRSSEAILYFRAYFLVRSDWTTVF